ncbi:MAG: tetratricopeptide repeat protein, partial [Phycisphaerae bacterium]|nr:tetratricopeptide repeat protein [Gemmatimonadaceae bacterium]
AIGIDSTNHLAYQHLVGIYQMAAQGSGLVLDGDTLRNASTPELIRAIGPERILALRNAAKLKSRDAAAGWLASDPDARQAYRSLSDAYVQLGKWDSAVVVLERTNNRPTSSSPSVPYRVALLHLLADDTLALPTLRAALQRYPTDSLKARGEIDRLPVLMSGFSIAGANGAIGLLDTLLRTAVNVDSMMPGGGSTTQQTGGFYALAIKLAMGIKPTEADKRNLARGIDAIDQSKSPYAPQMRAGSISLPYLAFLATGDTSFAGTARRWAAPPGTTNFANMLPELTAMIAANSGDTARAAQLVREFPSVDSLKNPNIAIGMAGLRLYARGQVATAVGDLRRAAGIYEVIDPKRFTSIGMSEPGFATYARSFLARGKVYEQLGESDKAIAAYEEFIRRWKNADAPLQPQVSDARQAIARLKDKPKSIPVGAPPRRG